jgi:hypothetical protein
VTGHRVVGRHAIIGYFPTRVLKVPQDFHQTPMIAGVLAILQLPKLGFV